MYCRFSAMPIRTPKARQLCSKSEFQLYLNSLPREVGSIPPARLKQNITRSRSLREKYRQLTRRRKRAARWDHAESTTRTQQKAQLFDEVLGRYEAALAKSRKATPKKKAAKKKASKKTAAKKKAAKRKAPGQKSRPKKKTRASKKKAKKAAARRAKR